MPLLPKQGYSATIGDTPIVSGRRATAQDFGAASLGDRDLAADMIAAGRKIAATATAELTNIEETEARTALVQSTEIRAEYARRLDQAALDGSDLGKLKEEMDAALAKVGENFQTKKGAEQLRLYAANSAIMYDQQANAINVQRAWSDAKLNGQKFVNGASALIQSNPAYLSVAEKDAADLVATYRVSPAQKAELTDRLVKDLNMAAAVSAARINPQAALKDLESGKWNLTPEQRSIAIDKSHSEIRAARAEEAYARAEQERAKSERNDKARDQVFATIMNGTFSRRAVMDNPDLTPQTREHLVLLAEARAKAAVGQERQSNPATKRALWLAVNAPDGDPTKIYTEAPIVAAVQAGTLNVTDADYLNRLIAGQKDENGRTFQSRLRERITVIGRALNDSPEYKNQPDLAAAIQMRLVNEAERRSNDLRRQQKAPDSLLDETSPDYMFKPGMIRDAAAAVKRQQLDAAMAGAVRVNSIQEMLAQPDGTTMVDGSGKLVMMSPGLRKQLAGRAAAAPAPIEFLITPSGETAGAKKAREEVERAARYRAWKAGE